ncbi:D-glycerate dehydrogenase [Luteimonas sp. RD2P54]|uniref:D-glycerate dehydrogenase n=1 Tax=Luteimonas endophytica TaxID=3042023 RepID=A0ABT6J9E9_9GAMM|nr:D-glycerate dehydrogenase [Luteimonas endophytica]MDH5823446.1 D-glycerate dehydrogenase [Luteimonas endophytica]
MAEPRPRVWLARPLFEDITGRLDQHFEVVRSAVEDRYASDEIAARLRDVDGALVTLVERIGAAEIAGAARLRAVANVGVGHDNLDIAALGAAGVLVTNTPDVLTDTTADFGFALLMAAARRLGEAERWLRAGHWGRWSFDTLLGADLHGSTLGILGMGRIGQGIARRGAGFGMPVLYHNRHRLPQSVERGCRAQYVTFEALLQRSDHLVLTLPHSPATHHLIDAAALARMKPAATLVNIARGGIVDETALVAALAGGRLGAAGLDVYEGEPAVRPELLALDNVVLTPHIASASLATRRAMVALAVDNLVAALGRGPDAGRPPTPVDPDALKR